MMSQVRETRKVCVLRWGKNLGYLSLLICEDAKAQVCYVVFERSVSDLSAHIRAMLRRYDEVS